jgi:hypothetical protein
MSHLRYVHRFLSIYLSIDLALEPFVEPWQFYQFLDFYTPWMGDQPVARPLPAHRRTQTHNKSRQTPMP